MGGHVQQKIKGIALLIGQSRYCAVSQGGRLFRNRVLSKQPGGGKRALFAGRKPDGKR
jgi:hypothetical protein